MKRYWVSWFSSNHVDDGCTRPPVQVWISGQRARDDEGRHTDESICAVIDAESDTDIWAMVKKHYPDYEPRFCNLVADTFEPGNRFPGFTGQTSLLFGNTQLREALAAYAHGAWAGWTEWMLSKIDETHAITGERFRDRWRRQIQTAYADLSESEKEFDRKEADMMIALFKKYT